MNLVQKLRKLISEKKDLVMVITLAVLLSIIGLYFIIPKGGIIKEDQYESTITDISDEVDWSYADVDVDQDYEFAELPVYSVTYKDTDEAESIIAGLVLDGEKSELEEGIYYWDFGSRGNASFNSSDATLIVNLNGLRLSEIERGYLDEADREEYFAEFIGEYLGIDECNPSVEDNSSGFSGICKLKVDSYEVVNALGQSSTVDATFNNEGDLLGLSMVLVDFSSKDETVEIIDLNSLERYLSQNSYPKDLFVGVDAASDQNCEYYNCYQDYDLKTLSDIEINHAEIVYYYDPSVSKDLLPVFELTGSGVVEDGEGNLVEADILVYANAIEPQNLIIESQE